MQNRLAIVVLLLVAIACTSEKPSRPTSRTPINDAGEKPAASSSSCFYRDSLSLAPRHRRVIAAMFATDRNRHVTTFGRPPADPSNVTSVTDQGICARASAAYEASVIKGALAAEGNLHRPNNLYVYHAGDFYIVTTPDWLSEPSAEIPDQFWFFDSSWNYLGQRAQ